MSVGELFYGYVRGIVRTYTGQCFIYIYMTTAMSDLYILIYLFIT